jgi:ABC-2 type transport system permease protein
LIVPIIRTAMVSLRRDRAALALSFILPITFFSIFAVIFGGRRDNVPKITVIVVEEDQGHASQLLVKGLEREGSLVIRTRPASNKGVQPPEYTAATAEAAVKAGDAPVALIVPRGFGENPISFRGDQDRPTIQLLNDDSDMVAWQMVAGLLQKVAMTSMPAVMAQQGAKYADQFVGGFTPEQHKRMDAALEQLRQYENAGSGTEEGTPSNGSSSGGIVAVKTRSVVGQKKNNPMVSF